MNPQKTAHTLCAVALLCLTDTCVHAQSNAPILQIGSIEKVTAHAVAQVQSVTIEVFQRLPDDSLVYANQFTTNIVFASKSTLDTWFQYTLLQSLSGILTNNTFDRSRVFEVSAFAGTTNYYPLFRQQFVCRGSFMLVTNAGDGGYNLPNLDDLQMGLYRLMIYPVESIDWAILETPTDKPVFDSRVNPEYTFKGGVDIYHHLLVVQTTNIIGNHDIKLMIVSGTNYQYRILNKDGLEVPEMPIVLSRLLITNGIYSLHVSGGDPGRQIILEGSTNMLCWEPLYWGHWIGYTGTDPGFNWSEPVTYTQRFFRVRKVNESQH